MTKKKSIPAGALPEETTTPSEEEIAALLNDDEQTESETDPNPEDDTSPEPDLTKAVMTEEKFDPEAHKPKPLSNSEARSAAKQTKYIQPNPEGTPDGLTFENCQWVKASNGRIVKCNRWHRRAGASKGFTPSHPPEKK
jgi:hypothetical protein